MKTVVIWDSVNEEVRFFIVDRDLTHLHRKYANSTETTEAEDSEITSLVYSTDGKMNVEFIPEFPVEAVRDGAKVIVTGYLP